MYAGNSNLGELDGDPSPRDLFQQIISLRGQLQQARAARGIPDGWTLAGALAISGQASDYGQLSAGPTIAQEVLGLKQQKFDEARHSTKRGDWNAAIAKMKSELAQLSGGATAAPVPTPTPTPVPIAVPTPAPLPLPTDSTSPAVTTPAATPTTTIATPAPAPSPIVNVTTTPGASATPAPAAGFDWQAYAPYIVGGGILLAVLAKSRSSKRKVAA